MVWVGFDIEDLHVPGPGCVNDGLDGLRALSFAEIRDTLYEFQKSSDAMWVAEANFVSVECGD